jgi:hypothetical protein
MDLEGFIRSQYGLKTSKLKHKNMMCDEETTHQSKNKMV